MNSMEVAILKNEILKRGYYGLPQWAWEKEFTDAYNAKPELLNEAQPYMKELAFAVKEKLFHDKDTSMSHVAMPLLEKWLDGRYPEIGESNKWMFEILASCGITCDASVFPASRDFGGFPGFQSEFIAAAD